jgi:hypothetical protein
LIGEADLHHHCCPLRIFDQFLEQLSVVVVDEDGGDFDLVACVKRALP